MTDSYDPEVSRKLLRHPDINRQMEVLFMTGAALVLTAVCAAFIIPESKLPGIISLFVGVLVIVLIRGATFKRKAMDYQDLLTYLELCKKNKEFEEIFFERLASKSYLTKQGDGHYLIKRYIEISDLEATKQSGLRLFP